MFGVSIDGDSHRQPGPFHYGGGGVTFTRVVLHEGDVSGAQALSCTVSEPDLHLTGQGNHELAAQRPPGLFKLLSQNYHALPQRSIICERLVMLVAWRERVWAIPVDYRLIEL